jgi:hypothetical protein
VEIDYRIAVPARNLRQSYLGTEHYNYTKPAWLKDIVCYSYVSGISLGGKRAGLLLFRLPSALRTLLRGWGLSLGDG